MQSPSSVFIGVFPWLSSFLIAIRGVWPARRARRSLLGSFRPLRTWAFLRGSVAARPRNPARRSQFLATPQNCHEPSRHKFLDAQGSQGEIALQTHTVHLYAQRESAMAPFALQNRPPQPVESLAQLLVRGRSGPPFFANLPGAAPKWRFIPCPRPQKPSNFRPFPTPRLANRLLRGEQIARHPYFVGQRPRRINARGARENPRPTRATQWPSFVFISVYPWLTSFLIAIRGVWPARRARPARLDSLRPLRSFTFLRGSVAAQPQNPLPTTCRAAPAGKVTEVWFVLAGEPAFRLPCLVPLKNFAR